MLLWDPLDPWTLGSAVTLAVWTGLTFLRACRP
jgi:hypothetical protein